MTERVLQEVRRLQQEGPSADLVVEGQGRRRSGATKRR